MSRLKNKVEESVDETKTLSSEPVFSQKDEAKSLLAKVKEEGMKMIRGRFRNLDHPGEPQPIIHGKFKNVPIFDKILEDGKIYTIPKYVAWFINGEDPLAPQASERANTCCFKIHGLELDASGALKQGNMMGEGLPVIGVSPDKYKQRCSFESLEFSMEK